MKSEKPRMIGYFTAWGADDKGYTPARVPAEKLTHLNYAFTSIDPNSQQCILGDPQADVQRLFSDGESVDGIADDSGAAVKGYLKAGVPPEKLVLGVPFYDRGWEGVSGTNQGLFQPVKGPVEGISEPGMFDYAEIVKTYLPTSIRHWHPEAKVPWIYQPATRIFISYNDPESLMYKVKYMKEQALGRRMFWEFGGDDPAGSLLDALLDGLKSHPISSVR